MKGIAQILKSKPSKVVHAITPNDTVYDAVRKMAEQNIGALLVMEGDEIVGIVTERDYARKVVLAGRSSRETPVSVIMTTQVLCVGPLQTTEECMAIMTEKRFRHLPVVEDDRVVGVLSIGDLVKWVISDQAETIDQLQGYISGKYPG